MKRLFGLICLSCATLACVMSAAQAAPMREAAVELSPPPTAPAELYSVREVCAESLHVRISPMGEVVGYLFQGDTIVVKLPEEGWSQIVSGRFRSRWVKERWLCK